MSKPTMYDHTKGPFSVVEDIHNQRPEIRDRDGRRLAVIVADYPMGNRFMDAHAALFAAAPDLLRERDELRNKVNKAMSIIKHGCDWQVPEDVLKNISDALK